MMLITIPDGRLGADPETRFTQKGTSVTTVRVATNEKVNGEQKTTWVRAVIFGRSGETLAKHFKKGDLICLSGKGYLDEWTDREGNKRQTLEMTAFEWSFVGGKDRQAPAPAQSKAPPAPEEDDDLPF